MFNEFFNIEIIKLLNKYPKDLVNSDNTLFWSGGKRYPIPIFININNDQHIKIIILTTLLFCNFVNSLTCYIREALPFLIRATFILYVFVLFAHFLVT